MKSQSYQFENDNKFYAIVIVTLLTGTTLSFYPVYEITKFDEGYYEKIEWKEAQHNTQIFSQIKKIGSGIITLYGTYQLSLEIIDVVRTHIIIASNDNSDNGNPKLLMPDNISHGNESSGFEVFDDFLKSFSDANNMQSITTIDEKESEAFKMAFSKYSELLLDNPNDVDTLLILGYLHFNVKDYDESLRYFNNVLDADPVEFNALYALSYAYFELDSFEKTIAYADKILILDSSNKEALYVKALALYNLDSLDDSLEFVNLVLKLDPNHEQSLKLHEKIGSAIEMSIFKQI